MIHNGRVIGKPLVNYSDTKAGIEALDLSGDDAGALAFATDTEQIGIYDGTSWVFDDSGGATAFLGLSDTPSSYVGQAGKYAKVNTLATGLEFDSPGGGGHVIQDNGTPMTQRSSINLIGFTVADDAVNDATVITSTGGGESIGGVLYLFYNFH